MAEANKMYAVVTGANKGIGLEICKQLASNGIVVVLTSRDEKRGLEALQKLKDSGLSDNLVFHQLDVADANSVASLAEFVKTHFGKLDILVNNAGVSGVKAEGDVLNAPDFGKAGRWYVNMTQNRELAQECLNINYYGTKAMIGAFVPLLKLSDSPRIVNVSSSLGRLKNVSNEWAAEVLSDAENLTEERIDQVVNEYLKNFKDDSLTRKGWPTYLPAYILSKASINAYTRILAKKYPDFRINCVCPGFVRTDINYNTGYLTVSEGADNVVTLALLFNEGPSGFYFDQKLGSHFCFAMINLSTL